MTTTPSWMLRGLAADDAVRFLAVEVASVANEVIEAHSLKGGSARVCAEALVATVILSAYIKGEERLSLQIQAEHPRLSFIGEIDTEGQVRGRLTPSIISNTRKMSGLMLAIKSDAERELYRGTSELKAAGVEASLADHLRQSMQVEMRLKISVEFDAAGKALFAAGLLLERLPGHEDGDSLTAEQFSRWCDGVDTSTLRDRFVELAFGMMGGGPVTPLERRDLTYGCTCSRERVVNMLIGLGKQEMTSIREEMGQAEINCHFCMTNYVVGADELLEMELSAK